MSHRSSRIGRNSAVYTASNLLQRALGLLLLPLYTRVLTPAENGVLAVVTSIHVVLHVVFMLGLSSAVTRFYFEYRDDRTVLREFWGSVLTLLLLTTGALGTVFLLFGDRLLAPILRGVSFQPFMAIGIVTAIFHPLYDVYLTLLHTTERAARYGVLSVTHSLAKVLLAVALVAGLSWGAEGALWANAVIAIVFFGISAWGLRGQVSLCLRWSHLRTALTYALPLLPHALAGQARTVVDRIFLNIFCGAAAAGIYHIAFQFGHLVQIAAISAHRAFTPSFMSAMKDGDESRLDALRRLGLGLVFIYTFVAAVISAFAREIVFLVTGPEFHSAYLPVPFLCFTFAANGIYFLFVSVLFYHQHTVRSVPVGTISGAAVALGLNALLIPGWGIAGASLAALLSQLWVTALIGWLGHRHSRIRWDYSRIAALYGVALFFALVLNRLGTHVSWLLVAVKAAALLGLLLALSLVGGRNPVTILREGPRVRWRGTP